MSHRPPTNQNGQQQRVGVIVVTHDQRALDVFDRILEMEDGALRVAPPVTPAR